MSPKETGWARPALEPAGCHSWKPRARIDTRTFPDPPHTVDSTGNKANQRCPLCGFPAINVLGQANFSDTTQGCNRFHNGMRNPNGVASDGTIVALPLYRQQSRSHLEIDLPPPPANRPILFWGKPTSRPSSPIPAYNNTLRGPRGLWIVNGKLFVADTQNDRVLIWNSIPTNEQSTR